MIHAPWLDPEFLAWVRKRLSPRPYYPPRGGALLSAQELAEALGGQAKHGDQWVALCPAHDDHKPSLWIKDSGDKLLVKCRSGCDQGEVISSLRERGLW